MQPVANPPTTQSYLFHSILCGLRQAVAALGFDAPKKDVDGFFDEMDASGDGVIE